MYYRLIQSSLQSATRGSCGQLTHTFQASLVLDTLSVSTGRRSARSLSPCWNPGTACLPPIGTLDAFPSLRPGPRHEQSRPYRTWSRPASTNRFAASPLSNSETCFHLSSFPSSWVLVCHQLALPRKPEGIRLLPWWTVCTWQSLLLHRGACHFLNPNFFQSSSFCSVWKHPVPRPSTLPLSVLYHAFVFFFNGAVDQFSSQA